MNLNNYQQTLREDILNNVYCILKESVCKTPNLENINSWAFKILHSATKLDVSNQLYKVLYQEYIKFDIPPNAVAVKIKLDPEWPNEPIKNEIFYTKYGVYASNDRGCIRYLRNVDGIKLNDIDRYIINSLPENCIYYYPTWRADEKFLEQFLSDLRHIE